MVSEQCYILSQYTVRTDKFGEGDKWEQLETIIDTKLVQLISISLRLSMKRNDGEDLCTSQSAREANTELLVRC